MPHSTPPSQTWAASHTRSLPESQPLGFSPVLSCSSLVSEPSCLPDNPTAPCPPDHAGNPVQTLNILLPHVSHPTTFLSVPPGLQCLQSSFSWNPSLSCLVVSSFNHALAHILTLPSQKCSTFLQHKMKSSLNPGKCPLHIVPAWSLLFKKSPCSANGCQ